MNRKQFKSQSGETSSDGVTLLGLVFVVFLALKLAQVGAVATWSWWWVTCPLWGPVALVIGIFSALLGIAIVVVIVFLLIMAVAACFGKKIKRPNIRRRRKGFGFGK